MVSDNQRRIANRIESLKYIDRKRPYAKNSIKISAHNSFSHELMKFKICYQLRKEGKEFITEVIFQNNSRADIICLDDMKIIEIICTEKESDCIEKMKKYPMAFEKIMVRANQEFNEKLIY